MTSIANINWAKLITPEMNFAEKKEMAIARLYTEANTIIYQRVKSGYIQSEIDSWESQKKGATDILAGIYETPEAALVTNIAAARSSASGVTISREAFAQRILANVSQANEITGYILGLAQGLADKAQTYTFEAEGAAGLGALHVELPISASEGEV